MIELLVIIGALFLLPYIGRSENEQEETNPGMHWDGTSDEPDPVRDPGKIYIND